MMKNILSLSSFEAKEFLLKEESYFSFDLPLYFQFAQLLAVLSKNTYGKSLSDCYKIYEEDGKKIVKKPEDFENVNYELLNNKDGEYAWRLFQLIHPVLYVFLVSEITKESNWKLILERFAEFKKDSCVECVSLPIVSGVEGHDKANQITSWWKNVEQKSIELAMDYEYIFEADIVGCYDSIYTHSIAWSLHTKKIAKEKRNDKGLIGNIIDIHLRGMSNGQTNGIPQGSVLMDFVAEIVLGHGDELLGHKLSKIEKDQYKIIRYRDDYRIFVNDPQLGKEIIKSLSEVMSELGMKLNAQKTKCSDNIVLSAIKPDKMYLMANDRQSNNIMEELYIISCLAQKFPNSGSVVKKLQKFNDRIFSRKLPENKFVAISILIDIAFKNPRVYHLIAAILSRLLVSLNDEDKKLIIKKVQNKFKKIPNTGHLDLSLQKITLKIDRTIEYNEFLCKKVYGDEGQIWNSEWLIDELATIINSAEIIDQEKIKKLDMVINTDEVNIFKQNNYIY